MDKTLKALKEFVTAAQKLNALWEQHLWGPVDGKLCEYYPTRWQSFDDEVHSIEEWLRKTKEAEGV